MGRRRLTCREAAILLVLEELANRQEELEKLEDADAGAEAQTHKKKKKLEGLFNAGLTLTLKSKNPSSERRDSHRPGERYTLNERQSAALIQLRMFADLAPERDSDGSTDSCLKVNLSTNELAASPSTLDGLLTIAGGVVQLATGLNLIGGAAAVLHGIGRLSAPDSMFTEAMRTVRKLLTPGVTVIQETVDMIAPIESNERSGLRDVLSLAAGGLTDVDDIGAFKHQLSCRGDQSLDAPHTPRIIPNPRSARRRIVAGAPADPDSTESTSADSTQSELRSDASHPDRINKKPPKPSLGPGQL